MTTDSNAFLHTAPQQQLNQYPETAEYPSGTLQVVPVPDHVAFTTPDIGEGTQN